MKRQVSVRLAIVIGVTSLCLYGLLMIPIYVIPVIDPEFQRFGYWRESIFIPTYAIIGLLITTRRPDHPIGWLFAFAALAGAIQGAAGQYAVISLTTHTISLPGGDWAAWLSQLSQLTTLSVILFLLLLFPTGRLLSRHWSPVAWSLVAGISAAMISRAFYVGQLEDYPISNPAGLPELTRVLAVTSLIGIPLLIFGFVGTVAMLIVRAYKSRGVERQQIKWFVFTAILAISLIFGAGTLGNLLASVFPKELLKPLIAFIGSAWVLGPVGLAIVTAVAILRYHLFDIDIIIRKTMQYTLLTGLLVMVYFGSVVVLQALVENLTGEQSPVVIVLSTLVIAALFNPLRYRVQDFIDRRFYRQKYDAEQALAKFATTARDEVDMDNLVSALVGVVEETMQPEQVFLWLQFPTDQNRNGRNHV